MKQNSRWIYSPLFSLLLFVSSILLVAFYWVATHVNVYNSAVLGALFELLSLPMLALLVIVPALSGYLWIKNKSGFISLALYAFLISLIVFVVIRRS
ncbi:MAG: hypothetical protein C4308_00775 [Chitinophagaceae bacterium]